MKEPSGFADFAAACSARLLRTAHMLTHDWAAAEDLLQDSLAKTWLAWSRIDDSPEAYARRILVTSYISQQRRRWRRELPIDDFTAHSIHAGDDFGASDDRDALWRALDRLPARQRAVVVLRYYDDLPEAAVAAMLHTSIGTVKSQASKALAKLRVDRSISHDRPLASREEQR
ncbi:MAG TPA: SigE family RNA polymerase sigma factor [Micromonosporaceae bacterium]|jgi:RNA polymerase sigma-70 factor (sigma-E family)